MKPAFRRLLAHTIAMAVLLFLAANPAAPAARAATKRVLLQGFWWDYWNQNYANNWSTYLADLAPRLSAMGIEAVWIPPTAKNKNATSSVGYSPFDHYDLGDKFQGGSTGTRFGTKDDYLRSVAILHANGLEVVQDIVWNHLTGAGSDSGAGGDDPSAPSNKYKTFRYVCWASPGTNQSAASYLARRGRFPKNWQNFHPNPDHNTEGDDITAGWFGPDICYYRNATGLCSSAGYNPPQATDYMRNGVRAWSVWLKKQTGADGFRIDAAKHFETWATKDFLWNLAYAAGFANGGPNMIAIGEWVGDAGQIDNWVDSVNASDGVVDVTGSFDFSLRAALKSMTSGNGAFDMGTIPAAQQQRRSRTVPFVNSHDTFRPTLSSDGKYTGWDTANEIGGHIDPNDPRIQAAYAVTFAVDGSPCVFFEDLFDLHSTGKRWTHSPSNATQLPVRDYLANLIWCRRVLGFDSGVYRVRWQAPDLLVMERQGRALIGTTDHWDQWQSATVATGFTPGTRLRDYSGASTSIITVDATGKATIQVPPCNGSNLRRGYAIWAPDGIEAAPTISPRMTQQEWEMADDLGDSHPQSLKQGGALPESSTATRTVGKIQAAIGEPLTIQLTPNLPAPELVIRLLRNGVTVASNSSSNGVGLTYQPASPGYLTVEVANANATNPAQRVYVRASYLAPTDRLASPQSFTLQPTNTTVVASDPAVLRVHFAPRPGDIVQWQRDDIDLPDQTNQTLTLSATTPEDAGLYRAWVRNGAGRVYSEAARLTVYTDGTPITTQPQISSNGIFEWGVPGPAGLRYALESSSDLLTWQSVLTNTAPTTFQNPAAQQSGPRFFRLRYVP